MALTTQKCAEVEGRLEILFEILVDLVSKLCVDLQRIPNTNSNRHGVNSLWST